MRTTIPALASALFLCLCLTAPVAAQFALEASMESGLPGTSVTASVTMDNSAPARGFSFGIVHDGSLATLASIAQGAVVQAFNSGAGADFFFIDTNPVGGPGGIVGCIISTDSPIEDIPAGTGHEVALLSYSISPGAAPASSTPLDFSAALGDPPVLIVISVSGTSMTPITTAGEILVLTPAVENLSCGLTDPCTCEVTLSWTNPAPYDEIRVFEAGALIATLPGTATGTVVNLSSFGMFQLDVVAVAGGISSDSANCLVDCPVIAAPASPQNLSCSVDHITCTATLTWTNPEAYSGIDVSLDGTLVQSLAGSATSATVPLGGPGTYSICLDGIDAAGCVAFAQVCCSATCFPPFVRGDANDDGLVDISDPIEVLGVMFLAEATSCALALDADDDELVGIGDAFYLLGLIFQGGPPPAAPFPLCGPDPTPGALDCVSFTSCP